MFFSCYQLYSCKSIHSLPTTKTINKIKYQEDPRLDDSCIVLFLILTPVFFCAKVSSLDSKKTTFQARKNMVQGFKSIISYFIIMREDRRYLPACEDHIVRFQMVHCPRTWIQAVVEGMVTAKLPVPRYQLFATRLLTCEHLLQFGFPVLSYRHDKLW